MTKTTIKTPIEESKGKKMITDGLITLVENESCSPHEAFQIMSRLKGEMFNTLCEIQRGEG